MREKYGRIGYGYILSILENLEMHHGSLANQKRRNLEEMVIAISNSKWKIWQWLFSKSIDKKCKEFLTFKCYVNYMEKELLKLCFGDWHKNYLVVNKYNNQLVIAI